MASNIQLVMYEGFLGADPELRFVPSGTPVCNFRIGSTHEYKNANEEKVAETTWIKVTAWGRLGEIVNQYCAKGSHVIVTGRLRPGKNGSPDTYELSAGGHGASFEVTASSVRILKGKDGAATGSSEPAESTASDDNIPF
jgi:single-strand DNA-binding protein